MHRLRTQFFQPPPTLSQMFSYLLLISQGIPKILDVPLKNHQSLQLQSWLGNNMVLVSMNWEFRCAANSLKHNPRSG